MPGTTLRTNYRNTGGIADLTAFGGAIPQSSGLGGAGTNLPYGGLIWISFTGAMASMFVFVQSAYGIMSAFYGSGVYNSGYKIMPLNVVPLSISGQTPQQQAYITVASFRCLASNGTDAYSTGAGASLAAFNMAFSIGDAPSTSNATVNFQMLGLVISGP